MKKMQLEENIPKISGNEWQNNSVINEIKDNRATGHISRKHQTPQRKDEL